MTSIESDPVSGVTEEIKQLTESEQEKQERIKKILQEDIDLRLQLNNAKARITELQALVKQISDSSRSELLEIGLEIIRKAGVFDNIGNRILLTPEILDIINKSNQQQT